jgi:hypothetical protein
VLACDNYDSMFIWSGRATLGTEFDNTREECKQFLRKRAKDRFPSPQLHLLSENDSMSRRLVSRLVPSHHDGPDQQLIHFPALKSLDDAILKTIRAKFRIYDSSSDTSFNIWFSNVFKNEGRDGSSLCE